jgi:hypothetical protein
VKKRTIEATCVLNARLRGILLAGGMLKPA